MGNMIKYKGSGHIQLNRKTDVVVLRESGFVMTQLNTIVEGFINT